MKKIININFQGRVIPIEETAYEALKTYVESLRRYFHNEDGRDEIINDIESRIAELFSERLKRGSACITDEDVNAVIASIGRPQDFEEQDADNSTTASATAANAGSSTGSTDSTGGASSASSASGTGNTGRTGGGTASSSTGYQQQYNYGSNGRLVRNADDKILAGVCSGLANYLRIDPAIIRILFVLFVGVTFWLYIILWIVVPVQSIKTNITKRLYRDPEHRVIGGVCGGLAAYFKTEIWIPRLVFGLPLLISIVNGAFRGPWFSFHYFPGFLTGSLVSTLILVYIVLWIVLPEATTSSERLEMRGEKIDLNTIRDEVKDAAQNLGSRASAFGQQAGQRAQAMGAEAYTATRRSGSGLGRVIGMLFKIFFFFIAGCFLVGLLGVLVGLFAAAFAVMPFKDYLLDGTWQSLLAWCTLILFLGVPIVAIIVWLIRRIVGAKSRNHYIGYTFGALWIVGLFCFIALGIAIKRNFDYPGRIREDFSLRQPPTGKLTIRVANSSTRYYGAWWGGKWGPFGFNEDSLLVKNVQVKIEKSNDSNYHALTTRFSNGNSMRQAEDFARVLNFQVNQQDSTLYLSNGFTLPAGQKFRNQGVMVTIQVPVGKRILIDRSVSRRYHWFMMHGVGRNDWDWDWDNDDVESYYYNDNVEYIMTVGGLEKADGTDRKNRDRRNNDYNDEKNHDRRNNDDYNDENNRGKNNSYKYRYKELTDSMGAKDKEKIKEKLREEMRVKDSIEREKKLKEVIKTSSATTNSGPARTNDYHGDIPTNHLILSPVLMFARP